MPSSSEPQIAPTRLVAVWLLVCCAMIFAMVVIGGVTRLTESGLSITEWQPVAGAIPPLSDAAWQAEFDKYRQTDQYRQRNQGMSLAAFQYIFWWEYVHRLWGRLIGVVFLLPFLWFLFSGRIRGRLAWRLAGVFALGGAQGALGWYMVQSGLAGRISVSPYRLTAHLALALIIYAAMLWIALDLLRPRAGAPPQTRGPAGGALALAGLVFLTIAAGGFVAGLNAGMIYNSFPLMDGRLVPAGYGDLVPWWRNLFENVAAVQFNHRLLGIGTLAASLAFWFASRRAAAGYARALVDAVAGMAILQVALGISTLLLVVPVPLAAAHQAGAVMLLTLALAAAHELRRERGAARPSVGAAKDWTART